MKSGLGSIVDFEMVCVGVVGRWGGWEMEKGDKKNFCFGEETVSSMKRKWL